MQHILDSEDNIRDIRICRTPIESAGKLASQLIS